MRSDHNLRCRLEIVGLVEVGEQARVCRTPSRSLLRLGAGGRAVNFREPGEPAEVGGGFFGRFADEGDVQATGDDFGDVAKLDALVGDAVVSGSRGAVFQREPEEARRVEAMDRGPAVAAVSDVRRLALRARD